MGLGGVREALTIKPKENQSSINTLARRDAEDTKPSDMSNLKQRNQTKTRLQNMRSQAKRNQETKREHKCLKMPRERKNETQTAEGLKAAGRDRFKAQPGHEHDPSKRKPSQTYTEFISNSLPEARGGAPGMEFFRHSFLIQNSI